jgi:murein DD-endopeptidase MepM/ murein hydrolase activator NlpD
MKAQSLFTLPFNGKWLVFWGGDVPKLNHHHGDNAQKYAFDFIQVNNKGSFFKAEGETNEDYFSFGQNITAPLGGVVVEVVDGVRDNNPGETNPYNAMGNYVMIKHTNNMFSILAHLKRDSVAIKSGDRIKVGDYIGQCGNSGNSSDPHVHFHVQSSDVFIKLSKDYDRMPVAKGIKVTFSKVKVTKDNKTVSLTQYSPLKNDQVELM